jgi:hypothetical protein
MCEKLKFDFKIQNRKRVGNKHVIKRNSEGQEGKRAPHVKLRKISATTSSFLIVLLDTNHV